LAGRAPNQLIETHDLFSLAGKTAVITGASSGIGSRMAGVLARAGARTAIIARRKDKLDELAKAIPGIVALQADLADAEQVRDVADRALKLFDRIDILVNNAGWIAGGVKAEAETLEQIRRTLAVNLEAPILLGQAFFPGMKANGGGSIINVTSIVASVGIGRFPQATYAASKGGLEAITREWAAQWSRYGIRINNLAPGFIDTEMSGPVIQDAKVQEWILRNTLIPRHGVVEDFDGALLFLASGASRYVTGQTLRVDGGWTAH
jgi:NAD(P)-dependent dehydrogenase (short-subunit alcohol dehydrogenase family)